MDFRKLGYFMAVAEYESFSKASQALHLSQPTLSKMIKNLESEWGVRLFDRSTRSVCLTNEGKEILANASAVSQSVDQLQMVLSEMNQTTKGAIRLGLPPVIGVSFFPEILARFHEEYPHIEVQLIEEGSTIIEQYISEGKLEMGVVVLPVAESHYEVMSLVQRQLKLVVPRGHVLSNQATAALEDLKEE
jgi:DNA-binding transcriptional LysR family regulator